MFELGQKVIYDNKDVATIIKVTPTGRVRIDLNPNLQFDSDGRMMGGDGWHTHWIEHGFEDELEEIITNNRYKKIIKQLNDFDFKQLSRAQLDGIIAIINEVK